MRLALDPDYPASFELHNRVKRVLEQAKVSRPDFRFTMQINMILETLCYIDRNALPETESRAVFLNALAMAQAALLSPCQMSGEMTAT